MASVYEVTMDFQYALEMAEQNPDIDLSEMIEGYHMEFKEKMKNCSYVVKNNELTIKSIDEEIEKLKQKKESLKKNSEYMKNYMMSCMNYVGKKKENVGSFTISITHRNTGSLVIDVPEAQIPSEFVSEHISLTVDKKALKEAVERGEHTSIAHIVPTPDSLTIR